MKVSKVAEMRALDRTAIEKFGIPEELLMENAGHAVYFVLSKEFEVKDRRFLIVCGTGHNGGDGLVVARKIHSNSGLPEIGLLAIPAKSPVRRRPISTSYPVCPYQSRESDPAKGSKPVSTPAMQSSTPFSARAFQEK